MKEGLKAIGMSVLAIVAATYAIRAIDATAKWATKTPRRTKRTVADAVNKGFDERSAELEVSDPLEGPACIEIVDG
jgi:hypothetical protein